VGDRLRLGIIGCGNVGARLHLPAWLACSDVAEVVGLADPTEPALEAARAAAGLARGAVHRDPSELIARADVDAVDVCTPQHLRRDILLEAIESGKHVLCEKPLAAVPADAAAAVEAARRRGSILAVVHNYLWLPEIRSALEAAAAGEIGAVRVAIVNFLGVVDAPGAAAFDADWRHDATRAGGGVLMDMLHGVYLAEAFLGRPFTRVSAHVDSAAGASVEDLALCRFETDAGAALVNIAWGEGPGGIEVCGSDGRLSVRYADGGTAPWAPLEHVRVVSGGRARTLLRGEGDDRTPLGISRSVHDSFERVADDFARAVLAGGEPTATGADGLRTLEATVAGYASAACGELVQLPLEREGPVFREGVLGLGRLPLPEWSPVRRRSLYTAVPV
jgi:predicted dehydrogenase